VSPIIEVQDDADSSSSTSTDNEHQLTNTTTSNTDFSPTVVDVSTVVEFQTIPQGPVLEPLPVFTTDVLPQNTERISEHVVQIGQRQLQEPALNRTSVGDHDCSVVTCELAVSQVIPKGPILQPLALSTTDASPQKVGRENAPVVEVAERVLGELAEARRDSVQCAETVGDFEAKRQLSIGHSSCSVAELFSTFTSPENFVEVNQTVFQMDDSRQGASPEDGRNSRQSVDAVTELESKRPSIPGRTCCTIEISTLSGLDTNSGQQVHDDVIVAMDNGVDVDVVGTFFTPSIAETLLPPRVFEATSDGLRSPEKRTLDNNSGAFVDGAYSRLEDTAAATTALLTNGADSSAVTWSPTNRFGVAVSPRAESSASPGSTSIWRKNPLTRLVRHRTETVCYWHRQ